MIRACLAVLLADGPGPSAGGVRLRPSPSLRTIRRRWSTPCDDVRARHDLAPLSRDPALCRSSGAYARRLMEIEAFGHELDPGGRLVQAAREVLAMHRGAEARRRHTVQRWLAGRHTGR